MKKNKRNILLILARPYYFFRFLKSALAVALSDSYYPEEPRKAVLRRIFDNLAWIIRNGETNYFYNLYGMDIIGHHSANYIPNEIFLRRRNDGNKIRSVNSQICLLRDKFLFFKYMKANGLPVPEVFGMFVDGTLYSADLIRNEISTLINERDYFIKSIDGECASFVKHIQDFNSLNKILPQITKGRFLLQRKILQHKSMTSINPLAVNTIRIVTYKDIVTANSEPRVFAAIARIGTTLSKCNDNTSIGGIAIGMNENGVLHTFGFQKPEFGGRCTSHPDTGIVFSEFQIPYFKEALKICVRAHSFFYGIGTIGWDIAISENGPQFIEGNDNWEISSIQAIYGGQKSCLSNIL